MKNLSAAIKLSEKTLGESSERIDNLEEEEYKIIDSLLETTKENLIMWKEQQEAAKTKQKEAEKNPGSQDKEDKGADSTNSKFRESDTRRSPSPKSPAAGNRR